MSVDAIGTFDDEDLRVRAMQGAYLPPLTPILPPPSGLSPISTLAVSEKEIAVPQHRPTLAAPRNIMLDVIDTHMKTEALTDKSSKLFDGDVAKSMAEIGRLTKEKQDALQEEAKAASSRKTWDTLSTVAQYVSSAGMIGIAVATGGVSGVVIGAAGVIGIGNRLIRDTNLLPIATQWLTESKELQEKIATNIETYAFYLQMGLGLAGGFAAWQTGAWAAAHAINAVEATRKIASTATIASQVMGAGFHVGSQFHNKRMSDLHAQMRELSLGIAENSQNLTQASKEMSQKIESDQMQADEVRKAIQNSVVEID